MVPCVLRGADWWRAFCKALIGVVRFSRRRLVSCVLRGANWCRVFYEALIGDVHFVRRWLVSCVLQGADWCCMYYEALIGAVCFTRCRFLPCVLQAAEWCRVLYDALIGGVRFARRWLVPRVSRGAGWRSSKHAKRDKVDSTTMGANLRCIIYFGYRTLVVGGAHTMFDLSGTLAEAFGWSIAQYNYRSGQVYFSHLLSFNSLLIFSHLLSLY